MWCLRRSVGALSGPAHSVQKCQGCARIVKENLGPFPRGHSHSLARRRVDLRSVRLSSPDVPCEAVCTEDMAAHCGVDAGPGVLEHIVGMEEGVEMPTAVRPYERVFLFAFWPTRMVDDADVCPGPGNVLRAQKLRLQTRRLGARAARHV